MENTENIATISRPTLITYKEFKENVSHNDGYGKCRRIFLYGYDHTQSRYKYRLALVGRKEACFKEAYRMLFLEDDESEREWYIQEGQFKIPISYNFSGAKKVD